MAAAAAADGAVLPTVDSVLDFEKIGRVGEGTYGVVCATLISPCRALYLRTMQDFNHSQFPTL